MYIHFGILARLKGRFLTEMMQRCSSAPDINADPTKLFSDLEPFPETRESACILEDKFVGSNSLRRKLKRTSSAPAESFVRAFSAEDELVGALRTRIMNESCHRRALKTNSIRIQAAIKVQAFFRARSVQQMLSSSEPDAARSSLLVRNQVSIDADGVLTFGPDGVSLSGAEGRKT